MKHLALLLTLIASMVSWSPPLSRAADVSSLTLSSTSVVGGKTSTATVRLDSAALGGDLVIALSSSNPSAATVPGSVTIPGGSSSATFTVTTVPVSASTAVVITASGPGISKSANLTVTPPALSAVSASPLTIVNGRTGTGTVTLTGSAPAGGIVVALSSSSSLLDLPAQVTVPAGSKNVTFEMTAGIAPSTTAVTVSATLGVTTKSTTVNVAPLQVASVSFTPASPSGGTVVKLKVTLNGAADGSGAVVALSGGDPSLLPLPGTITIPPGTTNATISVATGFVSTATPFTVRAGLNGASRSATITLNPVAINAISASPSSITGSLTATGTATLNGPAPAGGVVVALASSNTAAFRVPSSVTVPGGATSATFSITTSYVTSTTSVTLSASFDGATKSATAKVVPVTVAGVSMLPASIVGGQSPSIGTVKLTAAAPSGGVVISLTSSDRVVTVPASIMIPAGQLSGTFTANSTAVTASTISTIRATDGRTTRTAKVTVNPLGLASLGISGTQYSGWTANAVISLNGVAPAGGAQVLLSVSDPTKASAPGSLLIPQGESKLTFTIDFSLVSAETPVVITATYAGVAISVPVTIKPATISKVTLSPGSVTGGNTSTGTVWLTGKAPSGGLVVTLTSSSATALVSSSISIAQGGETGTFTIRTTAVSATTAATISATANGVKQSATLSIAPPKIATISPDPIFVSAGGSAPVVLSLDGVAPANGIRVALSSNNVAVATVPASILVPAGASSVTFQVTGSSGAVQYQTANITANYGGQSLTALVGIDSLRVTALGFNPGIIVSGQSSTGTVYLSGTAPAGGLVVTLSCYTPSLTMPATIAIPAGSSSATFIVTASASAP
ncbi:MAG TPA: hypothetical protein VHR64_12725, partial [Thermomicrobiales bacterium]|nr:hypothetical protein [Thermomicrobiales bacterium]